MKSRRIILLFLISCSAFVLPACINAETTRPDPSAINSYEECVRAGYPVMRSMPPRCAVPGGGVFTGPSPATPPIIADKLCRDMCGDGVCQEMVCMGEGCPCAESKSNCSTDCK